MTTALGTTLIDLDVSALDQDGYNKIWTRRTAASTLFLGAIVTGQDQTFPDIVLAGEDDPILGHLVKLDTSKHTLPNVTSGNASFYNDYDNCFSDNVFVLVGQMKVGGLYLILSGTNKTFAMDDPLKIVDGVADLATTGDIVSFISKEVVTGASNTRKYFWAEYVRAA